METRIGKWGNSLAVRIPRSVASQVGLSLDTAVELTPRGDKLVISLLERSAADLDALLARVTDDNIHDEVETGPSVGGESW